jgi:hypothetical protein
MFLFLKIPYIKRSQDKIQNMREKIVVSLMYACMYKMKPLEEVNLSESGN